MLNEKKEHHPLLIRKAPLAPLLHSGSPFGFLLCFNYCFELLMFFTFKYLNFLKSLNFIKFITSLAFT